MIWYFLPGVILGFALGAFSVLRRTTKWLRSLSPEDQKYVQELMHPEDRWKQNVEHDTRMSSQ